MSRKCYGEICRLDNTYPSIEQRAKSEDAEIHWGEAAATEHMQALEKPPERVKKFFQDERVKYAA